MIDLKENISADSEIVWVLWLYLDDGIRKLSTKNTALNYLADTLEFNSITGFSSEIDILSNHIGTIGQLSFAISRINELGLGPDFQNYFYPFSDIKFVNSFVDFGFCLESATDEESINWLGRFVVSNYSYRDNAIDINCLEYIGLENTEIPYGKTQSNDPDNPATYVKYKEHEEQIIPITFGVFSGIPVSATITEDIILNRYDLAPCLIKDADNLEYLIAGHKIKSLNDLYVYDPQGGYFLRIYSADNYEELNTYTGYSSYTILPSKSGLTVFDVYIPLTVAGDLFFSPEDKRNEVYKLGNSDMTDYIDLDASGSVGDSIYLTSFGQIDSRLVLTRDKFADNGEMIIGVETFADNVDIDVFGYINKYRNVQDDFNGYSTYFTVPTAGKQEVKFWLRGLRDPALGTQRYAWPYASAEKYYFGNKPGSTAKVRIYYAVQHFLFMEFGGVPIAKKKLTSKYEVANNFASNNAGYRV